MISIFLPRSSLPKSSAASFAAATDPRPPLSANTPDWSLSTPILMTLSAATAAPACAATTAAMIQRNFITYASSLRILLVEDVLQNRRDVAAELLWVFAHREMAEPLHDGGLRAGNAGRGAQRVLRRAGKIVLPGQEIERAF